MTPIPIPPQEIQKAQGPFSWMGEWEFTESWPGPGGQVNSVTTRIRINCQNAHFSAFIQQDGYNAKNRYQALVGVHGNSIRLIHLQTHASLDPNQFKLGQVLLELTNTPKGVITTWHALKPAQESTQVPGVRFVKS